MQRRGEGASGGTAPPPPVKAVPLLLIGGWFGIFPEPQGVEGSARCEGLLERRFIVGQSVEEMLLARPVHLGGGSNHRLSISAQAEQELSPGRSAWTAASKREVTSASTTIP